MVDAEASRNILSKIDDYLGVTSDIIGNVANKLLSNEKTYSPKELEYDPNNPDPLN